MLPSQFQPTQLRVAVQGGPHLSQPHTMVNGAVTEFGHLDWAVNNAGARGELVSSYVRVVRRR